MPDAATRRLCIALGSTSAPHPSLYASASSPVKWVVVRIKQGNGGKVLREEGCADEWESQKLGGHRSGAGRADLHRRLGLSSGTELRKRMATEAGDNRTCGVKAAQGLLDMVRET